MFSTRSIAILVLFLYLLENKSEQTRTNQNKSEQFRTGHLKKHISLRYSP